VAPLVSAPAQAQVSTNHSSDTAISACTHLIQSGNETPANLASVYNNRGQGYDNKGEHGLAIADYNKALELEPNLAAAYSNRGNAHEYKGEHDLKFDGGVFLFSWPSHQRFLDYLSDRETVDLAAGHLKDFVEKIVAETRVTKIHFVAHSPSGRELQSTSDLERSGVMRRMATRRFARSGPGVSILRNCSP
jgi:tetratricopeptide (TPR) repeat protein